MKQSEVLILIERVFVMLAQVPQIAGVVEVFQFRGIALVFLVIGFDGARVLHSAVDHFLLLLPLHLKLDWDNHPHGEYGHQSDHQKQRKQDVSLFLGTTFLTTIFLTTRAGSRLQAQLQLARLYCKLVHDGFPSVSCMLCGGPLTTKSWISTDVAEIRTTR